MSTVIPLHGKPIPTLLRRLNEALAELKAVSSECTTMPYGEWLRRMAKCRRRVAAVYRAESHKHDHRTVLWHALTDAAMLLELHADANQMAAAVHEQTGPSIPDGA
ncbi:hypothetical protein JNUCC0626_19795 [Lentzea sp. JNUCC 0626]|uniref:hypothetical protein n=1 Tax=Lentzea sp. JNUCC 0626 TaxID=3367513 RepID=UPI00374937AA